MNMQTYSGRVNFPEEVENKINQTIWMQWCAERTFNGLSTLLCGMEKTSGLFGTIEFFRLCALRMRIHSERFMKYQCVRGGQVRFEQTQTLLPLPTNVEPTRALVVCLEMGLEVEKKMEQQLRDLHYLAREKYDMVTVEMIESHCIPSHLMMIRLIVGNLNKLVQMNNSFFVFDRFVMMTLVKRVFDLIEENKFEELGITNTDNFIRMLVEVHINMVKKTNWINLSNKTLTFNGSNVEGCGFELHHGNVCKEVHFHF